MQSINDELNRKLQKFTALEQQHETTKREYEQSLAMLAEQQAQLRMAQDMHQKL